MNQIKTHSAEAIGDMLGDPLPADWRDALAIEARRDHLAALAHAAAEGAVEWVLRTLGRPVVGGANPDDPALEPLIKAVLAVDEGWRRYTHDTQRDDAGAIVYEAAEFWAGSLIASFIEGALEGLRADRRQRLAALQSEAARRVSISAEARPGIGGQ